MPSCRRCRSPSSTRQVTVAIRGAGPAFCSGGDLAEFGTAPDPSTAHLVRLRHSAGQLLHDLADRVTAHIHGACVGAGIELPAFAGTRHRSIGYAHRASRGRHGPRARRGRDGQHRAAHRPLAHGVARAHRRRPRLPSKPCGGVSSTRSRHDGRPAGEATGSSRGLPRSADSSRPAGAPRKAREWAAEIERRSTAWGHPVRVDGAVLLAERAALTGKAPEGQRSAAARAASCSAPTAGASRCPCPARPISLGRGSDRGAGAGSVGERPGVGGHADG